MLYRIVSVWEPAKCAMLNSLFDADTDDLLYQEYSDDFNAGLAKSRGRKGLTLEYMVRLYETP